MKFRFRLTVDNSAYEVLAKRKVTGKWEIIGTCHVLARDAIKSGKLELIQWKR